MVALFVLKLVAGITLMWLLMPRKEVTDGFFRIQMLVALGLCVLAVLSGDKTSLLGRPSPSQHEAEAAAQLMSVIKGLLVGEPSLPIWATFSGNWAGASRDDCASFSWQRSAWVLLCCIPCE